MFVYVLVCLIFGTTFGFIKMGIEAGFSPFLYAGIRFTVAGVLLLGYVAYRGQIPFWISFKQKIYLCLCGVLVIGANFAGVYYGSQFLPSGVVSALGALTPLMVIVIVWFIEKAQRATVIQLASVIVGLFGVLSLGYSIDGLTWSLDTVIGFGSILLGEIAFAIGLVLSRRNKALNISPLFVNGSNMFVGGLVLSVLSLTTETISWPRESEGWYALIYLIIFGSIVGHSLFMVLNYKLGSLIASSWGYITPGLAFLFGFLFLDEESNWVSLIGCFLVLTSVGLISNAHQIIIPKLQHWSKQLLN